MFLLSPVMSLLHNCKGYKFLNTLGHVLVDVLTSLSLVVHRVSIVVCLIISQDVFK